MAAEIDRRFPPAGSASPPVGYHPLEVIRGALYHWVPVPFAGSVVWCKLRTLNRTQMEACGSFALVALGEEKPDPDRADLIDMRNSQEALVKASLMEPTYEQLEELIYGEDHIMARNRAELDELEDMADKAEEMPSQERAEIDEEIHRLRLMTAFILPEDTFGFVTAWALGVDVSDIKKLSRDQLYSAAVLANSGKDNPSDHLSGIFTDRDREEINVTAWSIYYERNGGKGSRGDSMRWIGGPRKK